MPTKKIADTPKYCAHPEHDPPKHMVFQPGVYEHTCPACGRKQRFTVHGIRHEIMDRDSDTTQDELETIYHERWRNIRNGPDPH